jgi:hypothetical protein
MSWLVGWLLVHLKRFLFFDAEALGRLRVSTCYPHIVRVQYGLFNPFEEERAHPIYKGGILLGDPRSRTGTRRSKRVQNRWSFGVSSWA